MFYNNNQKMIAEEGTVGISSELNEMGAAKCFNDKTLYCRFAA